MFIELQGGLEGLMANLKKLAEGSRDFDTIYDSVDGLFTQLLRYEKRRKTLGPVILIQDQEIQEELEDLSVALFKGRELVEKAMKEANISSEDLDLVQVLDEEFSNNAHLFGHLYDYYEDPEEGPNPIEDSPWWPILVKTMERRIKESKDIPIERYLKLDRK